jgi:hypothetical protein
MLKLVQHQIIVQDSRQIQAYILMLNILVTKPYLLQIKYLVKLMDAYTEVVTKH